LRAGQNNLTGARNVLLGFEAGKNLASGTDNIFIGALSGDGYTGGSGNIIIGKGDFCNLCNNNIAIGTNAFFGANVTNSIAIGTGVVVLDSNEITIGNGDTEATRLKGTVRIDPVPYNPNQGRHALCQEEVTNMIVRCDSVSLSASGVKSNSESAVNTEQINRFDTALKEQKTEVEQQQRQIERQQTQIATQATENQKLLEQIKTLQTQIDALKAVVCATNPAAAVCQPK